MDYQFTSDWFKQAIPTWEKLGPLLPAKKRFLEIGSYEGRSMVWTVENLMEDGSTLVCIDTWGGSAEHQSKNMAEVEERFNHNQSLLADKYPERKVIKTKAHSARGLQAQHPGFDMVYVDGSHYGLDVMTDACLSWPLLKGGGIMVFDDYPWEAHRPKAQTPRFAIDTFLVLLENSFEYVFKGYQVIIRKR